MEIKNETRLRGMLGFAMRAGKVQIGAETVSVSLSRKGGDIKLVLIPHDASLGARDKMMRRCKAHDVKCIVTDMDASVLGELLGKLYAPSAVAITDEGFAREILLTHAEQ